MLKRLLLGVAGTILAFTYGFLLGSVINAYASGFGGGGVSWPLLAPDGVVSAPSYGFASQANTGIFWTSSDNLNLVSAGTTMLQVSSGAGQTRVFPGSATLAGLSRTTTDTGTGLAWSVSSLALSVINNSKETVRWDTTGRQYFRRQTSVPTMGACGTSPSVTVGQDNVMLVTVGTGGTATSCAVSFGSAYLTNPPICIAQNDTDKVAYSIATTTTTVTITAVAAFTASSKFHVNCTGVL